MVAKVYFYGEWSEDQRTCVRTRAEVTGTVLDTKAVAVFASVFRDRVVALSSGQLNSPSTTSGTVTKRTPLPPPTIDLRQKNDQSCSLVCDKNAGAGWDAAFFPHPVSP